jgi:non-homologous end joining protein Ku
MNKVITATQDVLPIIEHISELQNKLKNITADIEQHKKLLKEQYMQDVAKIVNKEGRTLAQWISSMKPSFDLDEFKQSYTNDYKKLVKEGKYIHQTFEITKFKKEQIDLYKSLLQEGKCITETEIKYIKVG